MTFATIPLGFQPPLSVAVCSIKLRLDQSQQGHGHQLHLIPDYSPCCLSQHSGLFCASSRHFLCTLTGLRNCG